MFVGEKVSKCKRLNDDLPQGSVLAPILFNVYRQDIPKTQCQIFEFSDEWTLGSMARNRHK